MGKKLSRLINSKNCEFIGSGYCQIISPSVPKEISEKNLELGNEVYSKLLKIKPDLGLVGEQVFQNLWSIFIKNISKQFFLIG